MSRITFANPQLPYVIGVTLLPQKPTAVLERLPALIVSVLCPLRDINAQRKYPPVIDRVISGQTEYLS